MIDYQWFSIIFSLSGPVAVPVVGQVVGPVVGPVDEPVFASTRREGKMLGKLFHWFMCNIWFDRFILLNITVT